MAARGGTHEYFGATLLSLPIRFVADTDQCILWPRSKTWDLYGCLQYRGRRILAHRMMWEKANGQKIPPGLLVMHTCDNRLCVNPKHLCLGSHADNVADCNSKGRRKQAFGTRIAWAKLTPDIVETVRLLYPGRQKRPKITHEELARQFGVSRSAISMAIRRNTWKQVP